MPNKKLIKSLLLVSALLTMIFGPMLATKPGEILNPNGFPSGKHYNLNIIGKKSNFVCPELEYDEFGNPIYGNVIFVPENGQGIQILMQSGKKGKKVKGIPTLQVIDPCTALFDSDEAIVQLPLNEFGECDLGTKINVWCKTYDQPTWVFNVADFVTYLWDVNNNGLKLLQIRFYPRSN